jgi:hypothetical protein
MLPVALAVPMPAILASLMLIALASPSHLPCALPTLTASASLTADFSHDSTSLVPQLAKHQHSMLASLLLLFLSCSVCPCVHENMASQLLQELSGCKLLFGLISCLTHACNFASQQPETLLFLRTCTVHQQLETLFQIQSLCDNPNCTAGEFSLIADDMHTGLSHSLMEPPKAAMLCK